MEVYSHGGVRGQVLKDEGKDILDFSANINPYVPAISDEQLRSAFMEGKAYPDPQYRSLKTAIAKYTGVLPQQVVVGNGATENIFLTMKALQGLAKEKTPFKLGIIMPTFSEYERSGSLSGLALTKLYLKEEEHFQMGNKFLEQIPDDLDGLWLCNPNNPTGNVHQLLPLLEQLTARGKWLIVDETFMEFVTEHCSLTKWIAYYPKLVIIKAVTKFFGLPGLRLGYSLCAHEELNTEMEALKEPWSVNCFAEALGKALFKEQEFITESKAFFEKERSDMQKALSKLPALKVYKPSANFILIKLERHLAKEIRERLLADYRILIREATNFDGLEGQFIRIAIKTHKENEYLLQSLESILREV